MTARCTSLLSEKRFLRIKAKFTLALVHNARRLSYCFCPFGLFQPSTDCERIDLRRTQHVGKSIPMASSLAATIGTPDLLDIPCSPSLVWTSGLFFVLVELEASQCGTSDV